MSKETTDTLGHQKEVNYALNPKLSKEEFINVLLEGLMPPPGYFPQNVIMNIKGYESFDTVKEKGLRALSVEEFEVAANETRALIIDTREPQTFSKGFIPNSINIGIDGSFATWVGTLVPSVKQELLIVADEGREEEVITRLARVGYDHALGYLKGGFGSWKNDGKETDEITSISVQELKSKMEKEKVNILDVRKVSEYYSEHILDAVNAPLDSINDSMLMINKNKTYHVHCAGGYRSMIFVSILKARGFNNLVDVKGGFSEIKKSDKFKLSEYVCPTTML